jgi:hypothetical protein
LNLSTTSIIAIAIILVAAVVVGVLSFHRFNRLARALRPLPAFQALRRATGLAVEDGKRLHISLGEGDLTNPISASALVSLSTLERIAQMGKVSDRPPVATSANGVLSILSQDTLRAAYRAGNALEQYDPARGRLTGPTPFSYIAGTIPVMKFEQVSANLLIGKYGPQVALLCEAAEQEKAFSLAASESLPAQAVLYASAQEPLIGEEVFAIPAYLQAGPAHLASLNAQDMLRWAVAGGILLGILIKLLAGINIL